MLAVTGIGQVAKDLINPDLPANALSSKQLDVVAEWVNKKILTTHIKIDDDYLNCQFSYNWLNQP